MVSSFMLDFFNSGIEGNQWGNLGNPGERIPCWHVWRRIFWIPEFDPAGMFSFGGFAAGTTIWSIQELPLYVLVGFR